MSKLKIIFSIIALIVFSSLILGCSQGTSPSVQKEVDGNQPSEPALWMDINLVDIRTGENFKISDFKGKPILLESFAVWCPTCTQQQNLIKQLHQKLGDSFVSISLDTDPNEDASKIKEHLERNGFDWLYAVSPVELTRALIDQFSVGVVNAPAAPVVLICEDGATRLLKRGLKSVEKLEEEIEKGC